MLTVNYFSGLIFKTETWVTIGLALPATVVPLFGWMVLDNLGLLVPVHSEENGLGWLYILLLPLPMFLAQLCHNVCHLQLTVGQKNIGFESERQGR